MDSLDDEDTPKTNMADRREHPRIGAKIEIRFPNTEDAVKAMRVYSVNVSAGGLCVKTQRDYTKGTELELKIVIQEKEFRVISTVAWSRSGSVGLRFVASPDTDLDDLQQAVLTLTP